MPLLPAARRLPQTSEGSNSDLTFPQPGFKKKSEVLKKLPNSCLVRFDSDV